MIPSVYPFHLHFYVRNPQVIEETFIHNLGMRVVARYGLSDTGQRRFDPEDGWDAFERSGSRFRLTNLVAGAFDLVLGPGKRADAVLEHFGLRVDEETYGRFKAVFRSNGLSVREGERRSFFTTPFGVRMELVAPHHEQRVSDADTDPDYANLRLDQVRFGARDPLVCERFFADTLGEDVLTHLKFETTSDNVTFRPVEVRLSSATRAMAGVTEILPGIRFRVGP